MWDSKIVRYLGGALTAMTITGCTLLLGLSDKQCSSAADCVDSRLGDACIDNICEFTGIYGRDGGTSCSSDRDCNGTSTPRCMKNGCVTQDVYEQWTCPTSQVATTATVKYMFHVKDFATEAVPDNIVVNACRMTDVPCKNPVATFRDSGKTGDVVLTLPTPFNGYFEILSAQLPALLYVTKSVVKDTTNRDVPVLTPDTVNLLATSARLPYDSTKGLALLEMIDCSGRPAGGVQFKVNRNAPDQFYVIDQLPDKEAKQTEYNSAYNTADGGFLNLEAGFIIFSAFLAENGIELGSFNAQIRDNTITYIDLSF